MNDDKNQTKEHLTERFKQLFEGMSSGVAVYEAVDGGNDFIIKDFNRAAEEIDQIKREDIIGRRVTEVFPEVEEFGLLEVLRQVWKTGSSRNYPISFYKDERITGGRENYIYKLPSGKVVAIYDDITERKQAEKRIEHLNLVLRAIRNVNQLITQKKDPARLLQGSCEILTSTRGYLNVWIALLDESGKLLRYAESKVGEDFAAVIKRLERGELTECAKKALSSSEVQMIGKPLVDCGDCPLADTYSGRSALVKRLEHEGKVYGILAASIPQELASDEEEQDIFSEVADDITFALHNFEVEEEHKQAEEELKAANQQLTTSEQHLRAANQQLSASEQQLQAANQQLSSSEQQLLAANQQLGAKEQELRTANIALRERVKELDYLYNLSTLAEKPEITLEELLQGAVDLIPAAGQHPEIICGRIVLGDQEFKTENFRETSWKQASDIIVRGDRVGAIEVYYLEKISGMDAGPFMKEEKKLIVAIAEELGRIAERTRVEENLIETEKRLRIAGMASYDLIYEWDVETNTLDWFANIDEMLGYKPGEVSKDINAWLNLIHPEDKEQLRNAVELHRTSTEPFKNEYRVQHRDGSFRYWSDHGLPLLDENGRPYRWIGVCTDITERKRAEEELAKYREHLVELVKERTLELQKKVAELERFNDAMVDREFRIKELRDEVDRLQTRIDTDRNTD